MRRAARWAAATGAAHVAVAPGDAVDEVVPLVPAGTRVRAQSDAPPGERLAAALAEVAREHPGPVAVIGTAQPLLGPHHAWAVADDLADDVEVALGPATDGGVYLLGLRRPDPAVVRAVPAEAWGGPHELEALMGAAVAAGLAMGWLRSERPLAGPGDAAALLADPVAPADVVAALRA